VSGNIGDQEASPVWIDGDKPVKIPCYGRHRPIRRADSHTAEFGNIAGKDRGLYLAGYGEFIFDREQSAFVRRNFFCCDPSLREHKQRQRERLKEWITSKVKKNSVQIVMDNSHRQNQSPGCRNSALNNQALFPDAWNDVRCREGKKREDHKHIVVWHEALGRFVEGNRKYACKGNDAGWNEHDLEDAA
jgi:hypothetical protein